MVNEKISIGDDGELKFHYDPLNPPAAPDISEEEFQILKKKKSESKFRKLFKGREIKTPYQSYLAEELDEEAFAIGQLSYFDRHGDEQYFEAYQEALNIAQSRLESGNPIEIGAGPGGYKEIVDQKTIDAWRKNVDERLKNLKAK